MLKAMHPFSPEPAMPAISLISIAILPTMERLNLPTVHRLITEVKLLMAL
jgi:hypothetical protein